MVRDLLTHYQFCQSESTFISAEAPNGRLIRSADHHLTMLKSIFKDKKETLMRTEITNGIMNFRGIKKRGAQTLQAKLVKEKILELGADTLYRMQLQ